MRFPFRFAPPIARLPFLAWALGVFLSQHVLVLAARYLHGLGGIPLDMEFVLMPLHWLGLHPFAIFGASSAGQDAAVLLIGAFIYHLIAVWMLVALAARRTADAGLPAWIAVLAILPVVQLPVIAGLGLAPSRSDTGATPASPAASASKWTTGAQGLLVGMALTVAAVAIGTLVFGSYGYGVFVISPFLVGSATAAIANRHVDMGRIYTTRLVLSTVVLGGLALVAVAIEGLICLVMAAPLGLAMAYLGGLRGRQIALRRQSGSGQTLSAVAVLPIVLIGEFLFAPLVSFDTYNAIDIGAPPARVWDSIVLMERIDEPPPPGFQFGMAYPLGAAIVGEGVGATRLGRFSTGMALERVTEWQPGRRLAFVTLRDVPAMRELSPYAHVHAPHTIGYFITRGMSFELIPAQGGTRLIERTSHTLRLAPALYWLPLARMMINQNNARVLAHIKRQAESVP